MAYRQEQPPYHLYLHNGSGYSLLGECANLDRGKKMAKEHNEALADRSSCTYSIFSADRACEIELGHFQGHHMRWRRGNYLSLTELQAKR